MAGRYDEELGIDRAITPRDFINGSNELFCRENIEMVRVPWPQ